MTAREKWERRVGPAEDRPDSQPTVSARRRQWRPDPRNARALDRFIAQTYGPEHVRGGRE